MYFIDRRLNPRGKSLENRQRFLRRAKALLRRAAREASQKGGIREVTDGAEVNIPLDGMGEPRFHRGSSGVHDRILPGNKEFVQGDIIPRPPAGQGNSRAAGEGEGTDAFRFVLTREEFLDLFLEDLELPALVKRRLAGVEREVPRRAGYSKWGSPTAMAVVATMRLAMMRRLALRRPPVGSLERLQAELFMCEDAGRRSELLVEVDALRNKLRRIPYIDPIDIRYRRFESKPKPVAQAVMFCLMDVSASMSEHMKDLAKRFYMLLYVFLTRCYDKVDIVFIHHTERAEEVDEETFFRSTITGGTLVSSALEEMRRIIAERYRPDDWNIYAAQASDGDDAYSDLPATEKLLREDLLPIVQYFAYVEVSEPNAPSSESGLWSLYETIARSSVPLFMRRVAQRNEIFPVFRELFQRRYVSERAGQ